MARYVCDKATGRIIPIEQAIAEGSYELPPPRAFQIMSDSWIDYSSIIDESRISGRVAHREHLRVNGCTEVGSEKPKWMRDRDEARKMGAPLPDPPSSEPLEGVTFAYEDFDGGEDAGRTPDPG